MKKKKKKKLYLLEGPSQSRMDCPRYWLVAAMLLRFGVELAIDNLLMMMI